METRAHHLLIGTFMLIMIGALFAFVIWLAKVDVDQKFIPYEIIFEGSVAGLNEGSTVRLNGVPVGTVLDISIPREDPSKVRVLVKIESDVPILEGSSARLELQGFTGIAFVQISGGQGDTQIVPRDGLNMARIPSERSPIQQVFEEAPNLMNEALIAVNNVKELLGPENRERVSNILQNLETVSDRFAARADDIDKALSGLDEAINEFHQTAKRLNSVAETTENLMNDEVRTAFIEAGNAAKAANTLARDLSVLVADNRPGISRFVNTSLPETTRLIGDLRRLTMRLNSLAQKIEDQPQEALFGAQVPEYKGQKE